MKLIHAEFQNFRLLRDVEVDFSGDDTKKLTVIRAANESGKTTMLTALQWALYGDSVVTPAERLSPIDWDETKESRVPISVTVRFKVDAPTTPGHFREKTYRIVRSVHEEVSGVNFHRTASTANLFHLTEQGNKEITPASAIIDDELPPVLREVFFTDGDRALAFISVNEAVQKKRERVESAIRSLLGLELIEESIKHIAKASAEFNKKAKEANLGTDVSALAEQSEKVGKALSVSEAELKDASTQLAETEQNLSKANRRLEDAMNAGDHEAIQKQIDAAIVGIKRAEQSIEKEQKAHRELFRTESLARELLASTLVPAFKMLDELRQKEKIPSQTIPVLRDRLSQAFCICGESIDPKDPSGEKRRIHIQHLIDDSEKSDSLTAAISDLYFQSESLRPSEETEETGWINAYTKIFGTRQEYEKDLESHQKQQREAQARQKQIPKTDIQELRRQRDDMQDTFKRAASRESRIKTELQNLTDEERTIKPKLAQALQHQKKGQRVFNELLATNDIKTVLKGAFDRIKSEELKKVSQMMNDLFLQMIGADTENSIIQRAEISAEFDILVYGLNNRRIDPDTGLNGASRRALTLAFILALTHVSEVEAPNVIDTPLGMMAGYVKRAVFQAAVRNSSQIVLFLTHDEIAGIEDLIDSAAGSVITLTNPAHYPRILVHDPGIYNNILKCSCNHRQECRICERRLDAKSIKED